MRWMHRWVAVLAVGVLVAAACGSDDTTDTADATTTTAAPSSLELVTFNAGLARGFVDLAEQRVDTVAEAIGELEADLVALQEVWEPGDVDQVRAAASSAGYDTVTFLDPAPDTSAEPACPAGELDALEPCVRTSCADVPDDQLADCVLSSCGAEFGEVCESCQTCLGANVGQSLDSVLSTCSAGAASYAYGGAFGIGLLSRLPVLESDHVVLDSSLNRRAILHAVVDAGELGEVHVYATHLSPIFSDIPYPGEGSWAEEQADQIRRLLELVDEQVPDGAPVVILGDLNTGPAAGSLAAESPENYQLLADAGFTNPYVDDAPVCTFCADNPLVGGADDDASVVIDHVLVRDLPGTTDAERVLDEEITVEGADGPVASRISDHYGVLVTVTPG